MHRLLLAPLAAFALATFAPAQDEKAMPTALPVNTEADEDDPHVTDGGLTLFFTGTRERKEDLFVATRAKTSASWGKAKVVMDFVTTEGQDRSACSTGGAYPQYLFFGTTKEKKQKTYDLYVAVKQDRGKAWTAPTPVMKVNSEEDELYPSLSPDGKALYFSRKAKGEWVQMVVRRPDKTGPGGWGEPLEAGLPAGFHHAAVSRDGKTMYVQGPLEKGRTGLFVVKAEGKKWGKPEELAALNDASGKLGDRSPSLSSDGKTLYFASDRDGGKGGLDLYGIPLGKLSGK